MAWYTEIVLCGRHNVNTKVLLLTSKCDDLGATVLGLVRETHRSMMINFSAKKFLNPPRNDMDLCESEHTVTWSFEVATWHLHATSRPT